MDELVVSPGLPLRGYLNIWQIFYLIEEAESFWLPSGGLWEFSSLTRYWTQVFGSAESLTTGLPENSLLKSFMWHFQLQCSSYLQTSLRNVKEQYSHHPIIASLVAQLVKNSPAMQETPCFNSWVGKIPWRREQLPTPVFWPREFHGLYSPWGCKQLDMTERLSLHFTSNTSTNSLSCKNKQIEIIIPGPFQWFIGWSESTLFLWG